MEGSLHLPPLMDCAYETQDAIKHGYGVYGWQGDDRLSIRYTIDSPGWTIWRRGEDNQDYAIVSGTYHLGDTARVILQLMKSDTRYHDIAAQIKEANDARDRRWEEETHDKLMPLTERLYYEAAKSA